MKTSHALSLSLLSAGLLLSAAPSRADTAPVALPAPASPGTSPGAGAHSQPPAHHRRPHPVFALSELTEKLTLTPDQQKAVGALIAGYDAQVVALHKDAALSREDKRGKLKEINLATRGQIRAALTPEQQKLFDAHPPRAERREPAPSPTPTPAT